MKLLTLSVVASVMILILRTAPATPSESGGTSPPPRDPAIIPQPARITIHDGRFELGPELVIHTSASPAATPTPTESRPAASPPAMDVDGVAAYLADWLSLRLGRKVEVRPAPASTEAGQFLLTTGAADGDLGPEGYELTVRPQAVTIAAPTPAGLMHGVQTFRQLLPPAFESAGGDAGDTRWSLPCVSISDRPRYGHRGMLLDCGRYFVPPERVKRTIDLLAYHKLNVLHWHLTEDQGWRLEIRKYPRLTQIGAWRTATRDDEQPRTSEADVQAGRAPKAGLYGGFYTQADVREIVAYAAARGITVIPEIELPGHCGAALAAYPELSCTGGPLDVSTRWGVHEDVYCAGNERVFEFLEDVLSEALELFPSQYIHIGGDEVPKTRWQACEKCQARMKAEGLTDEAELQSYFVRRIERFLSQRGRRLIGWDEILEGGLPPNATVQSWRGMSGAVAAASAGHDVISSPTSHCYLDYPHYKGEPSYADWMGVLSLRTAYSFEPTPAELSPEQARHVLGLQGNLWTEWAPPRLLDSRMFPRLCALAEVGWSPKDARDWEDFQRRMREHYKRLDALGVAYTKGQ